MSRASPASPAGIEQPGGPPVVFSPLPPAVFIGLGISLLALLAVLITMHHVRRRQRARLTAVQRQEDEAAAQAAKGAGLLAG